MKIIGLGFGCSRFKAGQLDAYYVELQPWFGSKPKFVAAFLCLGDGVVCTLVVTSLVTKKSLQPEQAVIISGNLQGCRWVLMADGGQHLLGIRIVLSKLGQQSLLPMVRRQVM